MTEQQKNFFDAVRNDPEMTAEQKAYWLSKEPMKPCPFCGSTHYQHEGTDAGELWFSCQGCGACGPVSTNTEGDDYSEAQEKWNKRFTEDKILAEFAEYAKYPHPKILSEGIDRLQSMLSEKKAELAQNEERLEHALSLCESVSLWNSDEITDSELSNGLTQWLLFLGELKECAGCDEIMDTVASVVVFPDGHKSYLCGECTRDGDHSQMPDILNLTFYKAIEVRENENMDDFITKPSMLQQEKQYAYVTYLDSSSISSVTINKFLCRSPLCQWNS